MFRATILTSVMLLCHSISATDGHLGGPYTFYSKSSITEKHAAGWGGVARKLWPPWAAFREENMLGGRLVSSGPLFHASQPAAGRRCVTLVLKSQDTDRNLGSNEV